MVHGLNGYRGLADAIILQAVDDYRKALRGKNKERKCEIESFFRSKWFTVLSEANPETIIYKLKREAEIK